MGKQKPGIKSINLSIPVTRIVPNLTAKKEIRRRVALTFFHQVDSKVTWGVAYRSMIFVWLLIKYYTTLCVCYSAADHERAIKETKAKRQKHVAQRQTQKRRQRHVKRGNPLCRLDLIIVVTARPSTFNICRLANSMTLCHCAKTFAQSLTTATTAAARLSLHISNISNKRFKLR